LNPIVKRRVREGIIESERDRVKPREKLGGKEMKSE
jgi:hypothetical protein